MSAPKNTLLVVDDEESIRDFLQIMLTREGYKVVSFGDGAQALEAFAKNNFSVVITDISMPGMTGIELLTKIKHVNHDIPVIVMTAYGSTESAVEAMKLGASDYLTKPFQIDEIKLAISKVLQEASLRTENQQLRRELGKVYSFEKIVGNSPSMQAVFELIKRVSQNKANILISGESGTGKELIAHAIHHNGPNKESPFVVINCGAIPEALLESELFGHKKGSFTGAVTDKKGLFEAADKGAIFLDEIGEMPQAIQVKLLRAIQSRTFRPIGAMEDITVDVRIIAATNRDLEEEVKKGNFREDLFYRLNVIQIQTPPLRERKEDIPILSQYFLTKYNLAMGKSIINISTEAMDLLLQHTFPGNVRELENIIERAVALESSAIILPESLPSKIFDHLPPKPTITKNTGNIPVPPPISSEKNPSPKQLDLERQVIEFEKKYILRALEEAHGVKKRAAEILGISFRSLRYRIEKYGIDDPNPNESE